MDKIFTANGTSNRSLNEGKRNGGSANTRANSKLGVSQVSLIFALAISKLRRRTICLLLRLQSSNSVFPWVQRTTHSVNPDVLMGLLSEPFTDVISSSVP